MSNFSNHHDSFGGLDETLNGQLLPLFGNRAGNFLESVISNFIPSESVDYTLENSSSSSDKVRVFATLGFGKGSKRCLEVEAEGLQERVIGFFRLPEPAVQNSEDAISHGWGSPPYFCLVVIKVPFDLALVSDDCEWIGQKIDVCLFDSLTIVSPVLACYIVGELVNDDLIRNIVVSGVSSHAQLFSSLVVGKQDLFGHPVCKGIIVDVLSILVRSHHVFDVVHPILALDHSTLPKFSHFLNQGKTLLPEPIQVLSYPKIVPCTYAHAASNVLLQRSGQGVDWGFLISLNCALPGVHDSSVAVDESVVLSCRHSVDAILNECLGQPLIESEHCGVDPDVHVPEHMTIVA